MCGYLCPTLRDFQEILSTTFAKIAALSPPVLVYVARFVYHSIIMYLVPRIPVCDHRRLFLSGHICTLTEKYMCGGKNWTKAHSWRGLARTEREPWLSKFWDGTMRCDAMRSDAKINEAHIQQTEPQPKLSFLLSAHE